MSAGINAKPSRARLAPCSVRPGRWWFAACLLVAAIFAGKALWGTSSLPRSRLTKPAAARAHQRASQSIEMIRVGQRVVAHNPDPDSSVRTANLKVDPAAWRFLRLRAEDRWPDGTLDVIEVETLQPAEWVAGKKAAVGATVPLPLDLLEMGLPETLQARVVANEPCPPIPSGSGAVVLTTVNHLNPNVFELTLCDDHGKRETIRPTGLHKFYSGDRRCWVNTQQLKEGERLRSIDGWLTVSSLRRLPGVQRVYNMTVAGEHVYHVSTLGLLSHNNAPCGDIIAANQQEALDIAIQQHGGVNDPGLIETTPTYGTNPNLLGPNGEPYEVIKVIDANGNKVIPFQHHPWGHTFSDVDPPFVEPPHYHGPSGHIFYPPGT